MQNFIETWCNLQNKDILIVVYCFLHKYSLRGYGLNRNCLTGCIFNAAITKIIVLIDGSKDCNGGDVCIKWQALFDFAIIKCII